MGILVVRVPFSNHVSVNAVPQIVPRCPDVPVRLFEVDGGDPDIFASPTSLVGEVGDGLKALVIPGEPAHITVIWRHGSAVGLTCAVFVVNRSHTPTYPILGTLHSSLEGWGVVAGRLIDTLTLPGRWDWAGWNWEPPKKSDWTCIWTTELLRDWIGNFAEVKEHVRSG